ncbi:MAG: DUF5979 domain-containing protein [Christensenellaceae bacterium]|jgi:LPXTG-motif cell wall-anchored protein|nr:DUF5979 domain-containing protein [Christensenellaceae bacterium]
MRKRLKLGLALFLALGLLFSALPLAFAVPGDHGTITGTQTQIAARGASASLTFTHTAAGGNAFKIFEMLYIYDPSLATFNGFGAATNAAVKVADFPDIAGLNATNNAIPAGMKVILVGDDTSLNSITTVLNFTNILPTTGDTFTVTAIPRQYGLNGNGTLNGWGYAYNNSYDELPVVGNQINMTNANGVVTLQGGGSTEVSVAVTPKTSTVAPGGTKNFSATVGNDGIAPDNGVTWALSGGPYKSGTSIDASTGVLTVDATETVGIIITVTATSKKDNTKSDTGSATVSTLSANSIILQALKVWRNGSDQVITDPVSDVSTIRLAALGGAPMPSGATGSPLALNGTVTGAGTVDFPQISYTAAGAYFYRLTELVPGTPNPYVSYDSHYVIARVDVVNGAAPGEFVVTVSYYPNGVLDNESAPTTVTLPQGSAGKDNTFTNRYDSNNLIVSKVVTGNNGDQTKDFSFTVQFSQNGDYIWEKKQGATSITSGTTNSVNPYSFTLKHGQSIEFTGLPTGVTWTVTESAETNYSTTVRVNNGAATQGLIASGTISSTTARAAYTNESNFTPPTGITADDLPFIVLGAALLLGLAAFLILRGKKRYTRV